MKRVSILLAILAMIVSMTMLSGCGMSDISKLTDEVSGSKGDISSIDKESSALGAYIGVTNKYNGYAVTFAFATDPSLGKMKNGEPLTSVSLPKYGDLLQGLNKIKDTSSGFKDVDESRDKIMAVLNKLQPLAESMDNYYSSKTYLTDNNEKGAEYVKQYLALKDEFDSAYGEFDALLHKHNEELLAKKLEALKKDNKPNAVAFLEINHDLSAIIDSIDQKEDSAQIENQLQAVSDKLTTLNVGNVSEEDVNSINLYKRQVNSFIGEVRSYFNNGQSADYYNLVIKEYNNVVDTMNEIDENKLDAK